MDARMGQLKIPNLDRLLTMELYKISIKQQQSDFKDVLSPSVLRWSRLRVVPNSGQIVWTGLVKTYFH